MLHDRYTYRCSSGGTKENSENISVAAPGGGYLGKLTLHKSEQTKSAWTLITKTKKKKTSAQLKPYLLS